ncbi:hypothetical protein EBZ39_13765 [bacterium]|nr:hypothetical protein [bacterium]
MEKYFSFGLHNWRLIILMDALDRAENLLNAWIDDIDEKGEDIRLSINDLKEKINRLKDK